MGETRTGSGESRPRTIHRDPETGQFRSHDDEPIDVNYSDHEFLDFRIAVDVDEAPDGSVDLLEYQIESDVLDLENDELGMVTFLNASMTVTPGRFGEFGGDVTRGSLGVTAEIGANLSGNEYLGHAEIDAGIQEISGASNSSEYRLNASDDPGLWAALNASAVSGFKDTDADGNFSGQGMADNDRIRRVFDEETSGGPYIDSTDDVNIGLRLDRKGSQSAFRIVVYGQMALLVFEYEHRRQEFAPYDPA